MAFSLHASDLNLGTPMFVRSFVRSLPYFVVMNFCQLFMNYKFILNDFDAFFKAYWEYF